MAVAGTSPLAAQPPPAPAMRWHQQFPGHERELHALRRWLESVLAPCPARGDVISVAGELSANAIRHTASGQGGAFAVEVTWRRPVMRVAVADAGAPHGPRVIEDSDDEHGRGLLMVRELSVRCGARGDARGRVVWADIAWDGPAPSPPGSDDTEDSGNDDTTPDGATALANWFGVPVWVGQYTGQWWALTSRELVSAPTAQELAGLLTRLRTPPASPSQGEGGRRASPAADRSRWPGGTPC